MGVNNFRFLDWKVYKDARALHSIVLKVVGKLPKEYRFELGSQIIRSSFSVVLNIAEGSGKSSDVEFNRFLNISLGSASETLAAADVLRYNKLIGESEFNLIYENLSGVIGQLHGFKKKLRKF